MRKDHRTLFFLDKQATKATFVPRNSGGKSWFAYCTKKITMRRVHVQYSKIVVSFPRRVTDCEGKRRGLLHLVYTGRKVKEGGWRTVRECHSSFEERGGRGEYRKCPKDTFLFAIMTAKAPFPSPSIVQL